MKTLCVSNACAAMLAAAPCLGQTGPLTLSSPDGRLAARFSTVTKDGSDAEGGRLVYVWRPEAVTLPVFVRSLDQLRD